MFCCLGEQELVRERDRRNFWNSNFEVIAAKQFHSSNDSLIESESNRVYSCGAVVMELLVTQSGLLTS